MPEYPDDPDGAVLADLAAQGVDMSQPLDIEFPVIASDESSANGIASALSQAGYDPQIQYDEGEPGDFDDDEDLGPIWDVYVNIRMVPEYEEIMRIQDDLDRLAGPFGGASDGWGVMLDGDPDQ